MLAEAQRPISGARSGGDERALLELVAAARIAPVAEVQSAVLSGLQHFRNLRKLVEAIGTVTAKPLDVDDYAPAGITAISATVVAFSPDGTRIVSGGWDNACVCGPRPRPGPTNSARNSPAT
jgi:hypothetical protein